LFSFNCIPVYTRRVRYLGSRRVEILSSGFFTAKSRKDAKGAKFILLANLSKSQDAKVFDSPSENQKIEVAKQDQFFPDTSDFEFAVTSSFFTRP